MQTFLQTIVILFQISELLVFFACFVNPDELLPTSGCFPMRIPATRLFGPSGIKSPSRSSRLTNIIQVPNKFPSNLLRQIRFERDTIGSEQINVFLFTKYSLD